MVTRPRICARQVCFHAVGMGVTFGTGMGMPISEAASAVLIVFRGSAAQERPHGERKVQKAPACQKVTEFETRLSAMQPCRTCRDILGMDITQPGVMKQAAEQGLFVSVCGEMMKRTCGILEEMLNEDAGFPPVGNQYSA